ncbi:MAG: ATP-binding protein, partial [Campylobacterota bacterium]|nr:ATP-binding protein [Campylobacterota bacterium]
SIKDKGIGIAKEDQEKIFELGQIDAKASRSYEGAGLGLNLARNLLKVMKGTIKVKSIPNRGSMFTIEVPIKGE